MAGRPTKSVKFTLEIEKGKVISFLDIRIVDKQNDHLHKKWFPPYLSFN